MRPVYLESYFPAILVNHAQDRQRITLVDGFCGGGRFTDDGSIVSGTPFLFLDAVARAERTANASRTKPLTIDAEYQFVDRERDHVEFLRAELIKAGYLNQLDRSIFLIFLYNANFETVFPEICRRIEGRTKRGVGRSIFLLDQKGYSDVAFETVRKILRFSAAECILTFAVGWLIDYLTDKPQTLKRVSPIEISEGQLRDFLRFKDEQGGRYVIQRLLLRHIAEATKSKFQSPFFLRSKKPGKTFGSYISQTISKRGTSWSTATG